MTTQIFSDRAIEYFIAEWKIIPSSGGVFEVTVNDDLIFSKKKMGRHAQDGEIKALLQAKVDAFKKERGITWETVPKE